MCNLVNGLGVRSRNKQPGFFLYHSIETICLLFKKKFLYLPHQQTMRATNSFMLYDTAAKTVVGKAN